MLEIKDKDTDSEVADEIGTQFSKGFSDRADNHKKVVTSNGGPLNLRLNPDKKSAILTKIPNGTTVSCTEFSDDWVIVKYDGYEGYCMKEFIK